MPESMKITVTYPAGYSSVEPWVNTDYFCPSCGVKSVWNRNDGGDCYEGERYLCVSCCATWDWSYEPYESDDDHEDAQRIKAIRERPPSPTLDT